MRPRPAPRESGAARATATGLERADATWEFLRAISFVGAQNVSSALGRGAMDPLAVKTASFAHRASGHTAPHGYRALDDRLDAALVRSARKAGVRPARVCGVHQAAALALDRARHVETPPLSGLHVLSRTRAATAVGRIRGPGGIGGIGGIGAGV